METISKEVFFETIYKDLNKGVLNIWTKQDKCTYSYPITDRDSAISKINELKNHKDVYFEICLQESFPRSNRNRGTADTVAVIPGLWLDVDVLGPNHKNTKLPSAGQAIDFIKELPFAPTIIVNSGGGLHLYYLFNTPWIIENDTDRKKAQKLSSDFHNYAIDKADEHGWKLDYTGDLARLLRVPNTFNSKNDSKKPVSIEFCDGNIRYNPDEIRKTLDSSTPQRNSAESAQKTNCVKRDNQDQSDDINRIVKGCPWMRHCRDDAETLSEPEWFGMLSILGRCTDGNTLAHEWSKPYPEYNYDETENKLAHAMEKGPHTCDTIRDKLGGKQYCMDCDHYKKIKSPIVLETNTNKQFKHTDLGNAERLAYLYRKRLRYCYSAKTWLMWKGVRWEFDYKGESIHQFAKNTVRSIKDTKYAEKSESENRINSMIRLASKEKGIPVSISEVDRDNWLLCCNNGTIDLRTGELLPHRRSDLITKMTCVTYDKDAECPMFMSFLDKVLMGDQEQISFLQRVVGYTLTGNTRDQCLFFLHGNGSNGKSTFLEVVRGLLGDYSMQTGFETFLKQRSSGAREDLARLRGSRFVTAIEVEDGKQLAEAVVKQVTGGDPITARFMHKNSFEFYPTFKVFWAANKKPLILGTDYAIWSRLHLIHFKHKFDRNDPVNTKKEYGKTLFRKEASGILNWAIDGCLMWQKQGGLCPPASIRQQTKKYRSEQDVIGRFLNDRVKIEDGTKLLKRDLYNAYVEWCKDYGVEALTMISFGKIIEKRGYEPGKKGDVHFKNIRLKSSDDPEEQCTEIL